MMQKRFALLPIAAAIVVVAAACGKDSPAAQPVSKIVHFSADLKSSNEVPANASTGTGTFTATLDPSTNVFTYDVTFTGLSSNVTLGHIHGPAAGRRERQPDAQLCHAAWRDVHDWRHCGNGAWHRDPYRGDHDYRDDQRRFAQEAAVRRSDVCEYSHDDESAAARSAGRSRNSNVT